MWDTKRYWSENKAQINKRRNEKKRKDPRKALLMSSKARAKDRGIEWDLTIDDVTIPEYCPILGIPLFSGVGKVIPNSPTIDRYDNTKGYVKSNITVISFKANKMKSDATTEEVSSLLKWMLSRDAMSTSLQEEEKLNG